MISSLPLRRWLTVQQTALLLSVHPVTVRKMIAKRAIAFTKRRGIGVRVDWTKLEAQLEHDEVQPAKKGGRRR